MNTTATTKTRNAEGTRKGTLRALRFGFARVAQLVEQLPCKQKVLGSTPSAGSMKILTHAKITRDRLGAVNDVLRLSSSVGSEHAVDNREVIGSNPISGTTRWHSTDASPIGVCAGSRADSKTATRRFDSFYPCHHLQQPEQCA